MIIGTEGAMLVPHQSGPLLLPREKFTEDRGMRIPEAIVAMPSAGGTKAATAVRTTDAPKIVPRISARIGSMSLDARGCV